MFYLFLAAGIVLGGCWRRWEGAELTGFFSHRWLKLLVAGVLGFALMWHWLDHQWPYGAASALVISAALVAGWTPPAQFGTVDGPFPWALSGRYGIVTFGVAVFTAVAAHAPAPMAYAPVGLFVPVGYYAGRRLFTCWTCAGEFWAGALLYGAFPLLVWTNL